jgi:hypothetical protein
MEQNVLTLFNNQLVVMTRADLDYLVNKAVNDAVGKVLYQKQATVCATPALTVSSDGSEDRFLTREEASKLLHVDYSTLWRWNRDGLLQTVKAGPRRVMYRYHDVMEVLGNSRKASINLSERKDVNYE